MHMLPFRMVEPDVQSFASFLTFRKMLDQQACGKMSLPFVGAHGDPHKARYLLRLDEIMLRGGGKRGRSEEHTSELQSLMRISYAVFCLKKKNTTMVQ